MFFLYCGRDSCWECKRGEKKRNAPEIREDLLEFIMKNKTAECSSGAKKRKSKVNPVKVQQTPKETSKTER